MLSSILTVCYHPLGGHVKLNQSKAAFYESWTFGRAQSRVPLCYYIGTNYCMNDCPDWCDWDCTLKECPNCVHRANCICTVGHLPRPDHLTLSLKYASPMGLLITSLAPHPPPPRPRPGSSAIPLIPRLSLSPILSPPIASIPITISTLLISA